jgi:hypothetical protein
VFLLDRNPERPPFSHKMFLPDDLVELVWPYPCGQGLRTAEPF